MEITQNDRERIEAAVKEAEGKTSGEIVPLVVERSGAYDSLRPRATLLGAMLGALVGLVVSVYADPKCRQF